VCRAMLRRGAHGAGAQPPRRMAPGGEPALALDRPALRHRQTAPRGRPLRGPPADDPRHPAQRQRRPPGPPDTPGSPRTRAYCDARRLHLCRIIRWQSSSLGSASRRGVCIVRGTPDLRPTPRACLFSILLRADADRDFFDSIACDTKWPADTAGPHVVLKCPV
jgi:hypothetical protein